MDALNGKKSDMNKLTVPEFGDIQLELMAKGMAAHVAMPGPVAEDVKDTMLRASIIIGQCILALTAIKKQGISEEGHLSKTAMLADETLMLIRENSK